MILFPAVDILDGKAVRLYQGDRNKVTVYGDPVELADKWQSLGGEYLHVVDLNGAFDKDCETNCEIIKKIVKQSNIPVQLGGGIRSMDRISMYIEKLGISRVVIGTSAILEPNFINRAVKKYKDKIAVGLDCKNGKAVVKGWVDTTDFTGTELGVKMAEAGVKTIVYTDVSRDGAMTGVNVESTKALQDATGINIIASGGVANIDDIIKLRNKNIYGVILGKSIYCGNLDFKEALEKSKCSQKG